MRRLAEWLFWRERVKVKGIVEIKLIDSRTGEIVYYERGENKVVRQGRQYMLANIVKASTTYDGLYLCLSSNSSTPSDSETSVPNLITPTKTATKSVGTDTNGEPFARWQAIWSENEANTTINSVAIAESSSGSGMWARYTLSQPINKQNNQTLQITYDILLSSS